MNEQHDAFDEVFEVEDENYFRTPNVYIDNFVLYLTSDEYKVLSYMIRNIAGRSNFKHHSIAISVIVNGRQLDKTYCVGLGIKEATVRKCLQSLAEYGFIVPIGKPSSMGQNWKIGKQIKMGELRKRYQEKLERDIARIQVARSKLEQQADLSCATEPLLSDRTTPLLSHRTSDVLSDRTHRKKEEKQKKETTTLQPAIADRAEAASHTHTSPDVTQSEEWPEGQQEADDNMFIPLMEEQIPAQAEKVMSPAVSPSPSLEATMGEKSKETTTPQPPIAAEPPSPSDKKLESPAQAAQRIKTESLVACGFAQPVTSRGWSNFKGVIKTLTEAKITPEIYADYVKWVKALAKRTGDWDVTLNSIAEKNRPETYMEFRAKNAISGDSSGLHVSTTPSGAKRGYDPRKDPAYAHLYASPDERKQAK